MAYVFRGKQPAQPVHIEPARTQVESRAHIMHIRELDAAFIAAWVQPVKHRVKAAECGTNSGYQAHLSDGTPTCIPCRRAQAVYLREYRDRKKFAA